MALITLLLVLSASDVNAQTRTDNGEEWQQMVREVINVEEYEDYELEELFERLSHLSHEPININQTTKEELEALPFLDFTQIEEIIMYLDRHDGMETIEELRMLKSLSREEVSLMKYFVVCGERAKKASLPSVKTMLKYGRHTVMATAEVPTYKRKGDYNGYLGYQYKHTLRYSFQYGQKIKFGLTAAQDAGEPFGSLCNSWGYDYYSPYFIMRDVGRVKALCVGRYRASMGMGLILNRNLSFGKLATLMSMGTRKAGLTAHSSRSEANFLQGVAVTVNIGGGVEMTAMASSRKIDATLADDGTISTILTSGYHRTPSEISRRHNATQNVFGASIGYTSGGWHAGVNGVYTTLSRELKPNQSQIYRRYYPKGRDMANFSVDYGYTAARFQISGETALDKRRSIATINTLTVSPSEEWKLSAVQRYYNYKYSALLGKAMGEGSRVNNESGILLSAQYRPCDWLTLMGYTDISYFPWARYGADFSSHTWDNFLEATLAFKQLKLKMRYRLKRAEKNNEDKTALMADIGRQFRINADYNCRQWQLQTMVAYSKNDYKQSAEGYMLNQCAGWKPLSWLRLYGNFGYFNTDGYASRIYGYEHSLLYSFSMPSFYGEGIRYALSARIDVSRSVVAEAKVATTKYFDRSTIGSGLQAINGSGKCDVMVQLRVKL